MDQQSVFFGEWIRSLREQYKYVVRSRDRVTLPSLTAVLHQVGFTDDELAQLRIEATMRLDDVGEDYVADMTVLDKVKAGQAHPAECSCPQCIPVDDSQFDRDGQPLVDDDPEQAAWEGGHTFPAAPLNAAPPSPGPHQEEREASPALISEAASKEAAEEQADDPNEDPDKPQQISMF